MPASAAPRRYARALFSLASEENRVAAVRDELRRFGAALEASAELREVLLQPLHPAAERRRVLDGVV
jgi:F0F1-type ATP synthase delta subunit